MTKIAEHFAEAAESITDALEQVSDRQANTEYGVRDHNVQLAQMNVEIQQLRIETNERLKGMERALTDGLEKIRYELAKHFGTNGSGGKHG